MRALQTTINNSRQTCFEGRFDYAQVHAGVTPAAQHTVTLPVKRPRVAYARARPQEAQKHRLTQYARDVQFLADFVHLLIGCNGLVIV